MTIPTVEELAALIDPDAAAARFADQPTLGARGDLILRRLFADGAAQRVHAALIERAD